MAGMTAPCLSTHPQPAGRRTSNASDTSLNFLSAASLLSGFLSGCHCIANLR